MEEFITKNGTKILETELKDCYIIEPNIHGDNRGYFMEIYSEKMLKELELEYHFIQSNQSFTAKRNTVRGLHFQIDPMSQAKLVRCIDGAINDVVVDLRIGSPTFKKWIKVELSKENKRQLLIPRGFAHGFITLTDNVTFSYMVDNDYSLEHDIGFQWNDPEIGVDWGIDGIEPILSKRDMQNPKFEYCNINFYYRNKK